MAEKYVDEFSEKNLEVFLKEENEKYLLKIIHINPGVLKHFSNTNIDRITKKFYINMNTEKINNIDSWIKFVLSDKVKKRQKI